jgi:hypothetical protein
MYSSLYDAKIVASATCLISTLAGMLVASSSVFFKTGLNVENQAIQTLRITGSERERELFSAVEARWHKAISGAQGKKTAS